MSPPKLRHAVIACSKSLLNIIDTVYNVHYANMSIVKMGSQIAASSSKTPDTAQKKSPIIRLSKGDITEKGAKDNYLTNENLEALAKKMARMNGLNHNMSILQKV